MNICLLQAGVIPNGWLDPRGTNIRHGTFSSGQGTSCVEGLCAVASSTIDSNAEGECH